ncbi:multidrug efflux SMR transporter [Kineosporia sp. J2-2]|uniref:Multidrug efflux SMR transporter n=1 Tax=Kineosporia corallincola TaxID=2835133 RepID=A0ABS5TJD5_9ACTN|nr:multidrug efflux SMR transporter [Kineosporia corallincola]MBT0771211.1 multidrug efflux SMR transporter [Kineosporia corallincola]
MNAISWRRSGFTYSAVSFAIQFKRIDRHPDLGDFVAWLALAGAIALEVIATVSLKTADGFTRLWPSLIVVVGYVGCFTLLGYALKTFDVGLVYAIWSAIGTAAITIIGILLFGETLTLPRLSGVVLIVVGVIVLNLSGGEAHGAAKPKPVPKPAPKPAPKRIKFEIRPDATISSPSFSGPISLDRVKLAQKTALPQPRRPGSESGEVPMLTPRNGLVPRQMRPRHDMETDPDSDLGPIFPDLGRRET